MKTHLLKTPGFVNPFWVNGVRCGDHAAVVNQDGTVTLRGETLEVLGGALLPGTAVRVWLNREGFFVCASVSELEQSKQAKIAADAAAAEVLRQKRQALRLAAEQFNARLDLPVAWDVGIKDVLSGLSDRSWGDGSNKATVYHIRLLEPLRAARLVRAEGDFLCTARRGTNGKLWAASKPVRIDDGQGVSYPPAVTCKKCLALASRWASRRSD